MTDAIEKRWAAMTARERDAWVAERVMNRPAYFTEQVEAYSAGVLWWDISKDRKKVGHTPYWCVVPFFTTEIAAAYAMEGAIPPEKREAYVRALTDCVKDWAGWAYEMVHATPEQRCKAALMAMGK